MINPRYYFYPYLPQSGALSDQFAQIVLKYPEVDEYMYLSVLSKVLSNLDEPEQKEFLYQLQLSEQAAGDWVEKHVVVKAVITEQLERSILLASSKLL